MTFKELAKKIGITENQLSRLKTGAATPNIETWMKILELHRQIKGDRETACLLDNYDAYNNNVL